MHKLLTRQLKRFLGGDVPAGASFTALFEAISASYADGETHRDLLERTLLLSSEELKEQHARVVEAERRTAIAPLERELAIARQIQTSILPGALALPGFEVGARMTTASDVGGDYYDAQLAAGGGAWLAIGDVSGHGLDAGLVMLMVQSGLSVLMAAHTQSEPDPARLISLLNRTLYQNIRLRMHREEFVTLCLLHLQPDGRLTMAGAHDDLLIWRARTRRCQLISTDGAWLGVLADISKKTRNLAERLEPGDVLVLHTDGITEAPRRDGDRFGMPRLIEVVEREAGETPSVMCEAIFAAVERWSAMAPHDDQTAVVARYLGPG